MEKEKEKLITFGPVPSRRLGRSLGINNIPPKLCSYSCIYCQLGKTLNMTAERRSFYTPQEIFESAEKRIKDAALKGERADYLAFVPDGEPTLDINIGRDISVLKKLGFKVAVISNASLIWDSAVREELGGADWVSLKVDAVSENIWKKINRPYRTLRLEKILQGIEDFSRGFKGELATETMLVQGVNDNAEEMRLTAGFISRLKGVKSYISIPTRPPAEKRVKPADEHAVNETYQIFTEKGVKAEYLIGYEGDAFAFTGDIESDLLSITSVHPMRKEAVGEFLKKAGGDWDRVENLITKNKMIQTEYKGSTFYIRKI